MTVWEVGMPVTADRLNDEPGYVLDGPRTTTVSGITTTEIVVQTLTFDAVAGARYKVTAEQTAQGDSAGGSGRAKLRYAAGTSVTNTSTQLRSIVVPFYVANLGFNHTFSGTFVATTTGKYTVGYLLVRNNGTATIQSFGSVDQVNQLTVERVG